jgi:hypothetical protein
MPHFDVVGLWVLTGVIRLISTAMILMINWRRPCHPLVLFGLTPMAISAYWILL